MKIISFVNQKGGAGKSILSLNMAVTAEREGEKVALLDLDPQGTVLHWYDTREVETPAVVGAKDVGKLADALGKLEAAGFSVVVIDTKGEDAHATRAAMEAADLCLIPIRPAGPDLHSSRTTMEALRAMGRNFAFIINQASPNKAARITERVAMGLTAFGVVLPTAMASRVDYQNAYALGQGVIEYDPQGKAAEEVRAMWAWVRKHIESATERKEVERGAA